MSDDNADRLIRALADFRHRADAMSELVDMGDVALPALQAALSSKREGTRWAAARCMGQMGTPAALEALVDAVGSALCHDQAVDALRSATGEDFGDNASEWRQCIASGAVADAPTMPAEDLVKKAIEPLEADLRQMRHGWAIDLKLGDRRHQRVKLAFGKTDEEGAAIVIVYSECGPAKPDRYEWALRKNMGIPYGAIAVRDVEGEPQFVLFNTLLQGDLSPSGLRKTIETIAGRADTMEKQFTGQDTR